MGMHGKPFIMIYCKGYNLEILCSSTCILVNYSTAKIKLLKLLIYWLVQLQATVEIVIQLVV